MRKFWLFLGAIVISFLPGLFGIMFTPIGHSNAWFNGLNQSAFTPVSWVFPVAWTLLYLLLGIALFMIIVARTRVPKGKAYALFVAQMILNALWSLVFFGMNLAGAAMVVVIALLGVSIWMLRAFGQISIGASALVWPYVVWLCLATYLNGMILYLNHV